MATTRTFTSLGVWAETATTTIPVNPISGVAYRDLTTSEALNEEGEQYNTDPNSATFNQRLFILSSFTDTLNTHGIVGWSDLVDYELPVFTWGSDNKFYEALQNSGPSGVGAQDPISSPTYWAEFISAGDVEQDLLDFEAALADETVSTEGSRLVGHTGETVYDALNNRPTFTALAATTGAALMGTTQALTVQQQLDSSVPTHYFYMNDAGTIVSNKGFSSIVRSGTNNRITTATFSVPQPNINYRVTATAISTALNGRIINEIELATNNVIFKTIDPSGALEASGMYIEIKNPG